MDDYIDYPNFTYTSPKRRCAVCLWMMGFGYDRIAKRIAWDKSNVARLIPKLLKEQLIEPRLEHRPYEKQRRFKPYTNPIFSALQAMASKPKKRQIVRLRRYVWRWLFRGYNSPIAEAMTGCSRNHFKSHIKAQFKPPMAWNNYASIWELDHIIPCSKFNLSNPKDVVACFHFSNYQPLLTSSNRSKFTRIHPHQPELPIPLASH